MFKDTNRTNACSWPKCIFNACLDTWGICSNKLECNEITLHFPSFSRNNFALWTSKEKLRKAHHVDFKHIGEESNRVEEQPNQIKV